MPSDSAAAQNEIFAFLGNPSTYAGSSGSVRHVERIDTHGAVVFLAGGDVYKVKRAVRFPFMDFSSLEKRRIACEHEIAVNRRNAPELYLGVMPLRRDSHGLHIGGDKGEAVEWVVHLARFDENCTFDRLADRGELDPADMAPLAEAIMTSHAHAPRVEDRATEMLRTQLEDTLDAIMAARDIFPADRSRHLRECAVAAFAAQEPLLAAREKSGFVRACHGDLHLRNIVRHKGRPVLFDAIEFDDSIATCDVLYDFAFVLMDLWQRNLKLHASRLFNLYLWRAENIEGLLEGLAALPLFLSLRAAIRARVTVELLRLDSRLGESRIEEAQRFFAAAIDFLAERPLRLVAIGGLSGSGKSTLAKAIAPHIGRAPGAVHLRSDIERKRLFNVAATQRLPEDAYSAGVTNRVYRRLRDLASIALRAGHSVIVDAVHAKAEEREAIAAVAEQCHADFKGLWLDAPAEQLIARVESRKDDASDAKQAVVRGQLDWDLGEIFWQRLDTSKALSEIEDAALRGIAL